MNREELEKAARLLPLDIQMFAEDPDNDAGDGEQGNNQDDGDNKNTGSDDKSKEKEPEKKYTDDDVNKISKKNSDKAVNKLMKDLGIDDVEEAKTILANARAEKEKNKSAEEKANDLSNSLTEKDKKIAEKNQQLVEALLENRLLHSGVESSKIARAVKMISTSSVLNEDGEVDSDLMTSEIEKLLKDFPEFKSKSSEDGKEKGFKFGSDGKDDKAKKQDVASATKRWNRFR